MPDRSSEMKVSKAVVAELRSLSSSDAESIVTFLQRLAENPYDQRLIKAANAKGDIFASSVTNTLYVYWSFDMKGNIPDLKMQPKINVLGLARRRADHGLVPVLSVMDEKLKTA